MVSALVMTGMMGTTRPSSYMNLYMQGWQGWQGWRGRRRARPAGGCAGAALALQFQGRAPRADMRGGCACAPADLPCAAGART
jgi:hypothetical protein